MTKFSFYTLAFVCTVPVWADCVDGSRDTTDAEKQFYVETLNAVKALLPAPPAGWTLEDRTRISAPGLVCTGSGKLPMRASYDVRFYWQDGIRELSKKNAEYDKRIAALRQLPPEKQQEFDEVGRKGRDLDRQARKLLATDKAEAEKLRAEVRELTKVAHEIRQAHLKSMVPQIDAISKERFAATGEVTTDIRLRIHVNGYNLELPEGGESISLPGATVAMRSPKQTLVAFGAWDRKGSSLKPVYSTGQTTVIKNLIVEAAGNPEHVNQLLAGLNASSVTALITK